MSQNIIKRLSVIDRVSWWIVDFERKKKGKEDMIEKIGKEGDETLSEYCRDFVKLVNEKKKEQERVIIAEIGLGIGTTTVEVIKSLEKDDEYYLFDYTDVVDEITRNIEKFQYQFTVKKYGNSHKVYDSYCWALARLVLEMRENGKEGIFDVVYLDGAHTLFHDGLAAELLKQLVKSGGYIVFDDVYWSMGTSPTVSKSEGLRNNYTDEQIQSCHIDLVLELFFRQDTNFEQIYFSENKKPGKATFRKIK